MEKSVLRIRGSLNIHLIRFIPRMDIVNILLLSTEDSFYCLFNIALFLATEIVPVWNCEFVETTFMLYHSDFVKKYKITTVWNVMLCKWIKVYSNFNPLYLDMCIKNVRQCFCKKQQNTIHNLLAIHRDKLLLILLPP